MPRPISWLIRLHEIRRAVASSVRSHYERKEIESLFLVQPRAAQLLLEMLPTTAVGRSRLVEASGDEADLDRVGGEPGEPTPTKVVGAPQIGTGRQRRGLRRSLHVGAPDPQRPRADDLGAVRSLDRRLQ